MCIESSGKLTIQILSSFFAYLVVSSKGKTVAFSMRNCLCVCKLKVSVHNVPYIYMYFMIFLTMYH